ncbi:MAG TPA: DUF3536 domain-containing protein [Nitriliruptorales bacterium]|nr:DUF3536 domain-containing protein [Nitriliruptorales bacterium]
MPRYVCIHGHFYQPPRENPWLETVEVQDSAHPYHDWNERVTAECYRQNAASRILDGAGRIVHVVNNYARISFDLGPTLLAWMAAHAREVYAAVLQADRDSQERFSGHGSAIAQAHSHLIMPLANARDRRTQVVWGIRDFVHRFGRPPQGMWLPETAVDLHTLELLAEHGIRFTILAPHQARRVRASGTEQWAEVTAAEVDTSRPYRLALPSGASLALFLYDGPISRAVAFEGLLADGARFAGRLLAAFPPAASGHQLVHIATDGESYGHHHRHGDMALAYALHELEASDGVELTNYAEFLERFPPRHDVEVNEHTSWSCGHGVERWRADCGCADGGHPGWDQAWRQPLRAALDWLRDELAPRYVDLARRYLHDPWAARDAYIDVLLDRSAREAFLREHARRDLAADERSAVWKLLELQRHAMLMYTSCGWFFDDLARIETVQVLRYAGRAVQLAGDLFGDGLERRFLEHLADARSNDPDEGDGRRVYERHVRPAMVDVHKVVADHAFSALFDPHEVPTATRAHTVTLDAHATMTAGDARLATGRAQVRSTITDERARVEYVVLHLGDHNLDGGVRDAGDDEAYAAMFADLRAAFAMADFPATIRRLDRHFGTRRYSLSTLFRDEQRRILRTILDSSIQDARAAYRSIFRSRAPLMRYLTELGVPLPRTFQRAADVVVNDDLRRAFADEHLDAQHVQSLLDDARAWSVDLDAVGLAHALNATIERVTGQLARELPLLERSDPERLEFFRRAVTLVRLARSLPFEVDLWRSQNLFYDTLRRHDPNLQRRAARGDPRARAWVGHFQELGDALGVSVDARPL